MPQVIFQVFCIILYRSHPLLKSLCATLKLAFKMRAPLGFIVLSNQVLNNKAILSCYSLFTIWEILANIFFLIISVYIFRL